jgi:omega-6 fatty acid desaturase (delta-12 desaturase)
LSVTTLPSETPESEASGPPPTGGRPRAGSLKPALDAIPEACYERPTWRGLAYFARDLVLYGMVVAGLVATNAWYLVIPLWILSGFVVAGLFIVGHDAAHGALFRQSWLNALVGRVAMLPSLHVFESWVVGHNRVHHGHTVKQQLDFVWHPVTAEEYAEMPWPLKARHRLEWSFVGTGAYYLRDVWWSKMVRFDPPPRFAARIRKDKWLVQGFALVATVGLVAAGSAGDASLLAGVWLWFKVLVVPFLAFTTVIGWAVHVHHIDRDIRWWHRHEWDKVKGQLEGTTVLHAPAWLNLFVHWIFEHSPHHVDTRIPMYHLPQASQALIAEFPDEIIERDLRFRDFLANTRACKLYDFDEGRWMTYAEGRQRASQA